MSLGRINKVESFGSVDGPGIRFVVFTQGCPMRCKFCHNPETWKFARPSGEGAGCTPEKSATGEGDTPGYDISADELLARALRYKTYWGRDGGITVSGGEPLAQLDFMLEFFEKAKAAGVHTCIDTSGVTFTRHGSTFEKIQKLMDLTDLLLVDIKHIDEPAHRDLTAHGNENIIDFFRYLDEIHKPIWIRHVLVPGISDDDAALLRTRDFIRTLSNVERIDVLPYHAFALAKYEELGIDYALKNVQSPSKERVENANRILETEKYTRWKKA